MTAGRYKYPPVRHISWRPYRRHQGLINVIKKLFDNQQGAPSKTKIFKMVVPRGLDHSHRSRSAVSAPQAQQRGEAKRSAVKRPSGFLLGLGLLSGIFLFLIVKGTSVWIQGHGLQQQIGNYQAQLQQLKVEQEYLTHEKELLLNDTYIERLAREELGLIFPEERVIIPAKTGQ